MVWTMVSIGVILLFAILVFILQNGQRVRVRFLVVNGTLPLGAALLFAALLGALLVLVAGAARVLQPRVVSRRHRRATGYPDLDRPPQTAAKYPWPKRSGRFSPHRSNRFQQSQRPGFQVSDQGFGASGRTRTCNLRIRSRPTNRLVSRVGDRLEISGDLVEDLVGGLGPDKRPGLLVPGVDPGLDRAGRLGDRPVAATPQPLAGQLGEPPLDQVQPRAVGRGEVQLEARVGDQPAPDRRGLVVELSQITCTSSSAGTAGSTPSRNHRNSMARWPGVI
jgi:uncharacterized integral membrane protein